jgi:hypothetical protein
MMVQVLKRNIILRSYLWGIAGSAALLVIYFLILTFSNSLSHAVDELIALGLWIALLSLGFGIQTGLFTYVRGSLRARASARATASIAASGSMSATAMVACCMHHLADILPIIGISAASLFLIKYQSIFLAIGVGSNLVGITFMLRLIQNQELYEPDQGILGKVLKFDMNRALFISVLLGIVLAATTLTGTIY